MNGRVVIGGQLDPAEALHIGTLAEERERYAPVELGLRDLLQPFVAGTGHLLVLSEALLAGGHARQLRSTSPVEQVFFTIIRCLTSSTSSVS